MEKFEELVTAKAYLLMSEAMRRTTSFLTAYPAKMGQGVVVSDNISQLDEQCIATQDSGADFAVLQIVFPLNLRQFGVNARPGNTGVMQYRRLEQIIKFCL